MPGLFTFVNVQLDNETSKSRSRSRAISAKDQHTIRSRAAAGSNGRRRQTEGDTSTAGRRKGSNNLKEATRTASAKLVVATRSCSGESSATEVACNIFEPYDSPSWSSTAFSEPNSCILGSPSESTEEIDADIATFSTPVALEHDTEVGEMSRYAQQLTLGTCSKMVKHVRTGRIDPFWAFSIPFRPCLSAAINHRLTYLSPPYPDLDLQFGENAMRKFFFISSDCPANLFATALFSATNMHLLGQDPSTEHPIRETDLVWLKGSTYGALHRVVKKAGKSKAEIASCLRALMTMACYERCFGEDNKMKEMPIQVIIELIKQVGGWDGLDLLQKRLIQMMEIFKLVTEGAITEAQMSAKQIGIDMNPRITNHLLALFCSDPQPYTYDWLNSKIKDIGSSIFRASGGRF